MASTWGDIELLPGWNEAVPSAWRFVMCPVAQPQPMGATATGKRTGPQSRWALSCAHEGLVATNQLAPNLPESHHPSTQPRAISSELNVRLMDRKRTD
jgi:hypothetical protein